MNASDFPDAVPVVTTTFSPRPPLPGLGLVAVEGGDSGRDECGCDARVEVVRHRLELRVAGWLDARVGDLLPLEEVGPARRDGRHR